jgi:mannose-6-phosphate isomerase-like protein (cupin superfamily)
MLDFAILDYTDSVAFEDDDIAVLGFAGRQQLCTAGTTFVVVAGGALTLSNDTGHYQLGAGMYACAPASAAVTGRNCRALLVTAKHYRGIFALGGPAENGGRLRYIDGCSDTGLIQPLKRGDPCLNYLHFPGRTRQTPHHHPSHRVGLVLAGEGLCHHKGANGGASGDWRTTPMARGSMWLIPAGAEHWFETADATLRVVAFHPDSEFGPTDEDHQMLNATLMEEARA